LKLLYSILLISILSNILIAQNEDNISKENNSTDDSFLSLLEYGRMLYKNPRGIACSKCHGLKGEGGKKIAKYYDKHQNIKLLRSSDIRGYSLKELTDSLSNHYRENGRRKRHKIMPVYYMTKEEILAIYTYLKSNREKR